MEVKKRRKEEEKKAEEARKTLLEKHNEQLQKEQGIKISAFFLLVDEINKKILEKEIDEKQKLIEEEERILKNVTEAGGILIF